MSHPSATTSSLAGMLLGSAKQRVVLFFLTVFFSSGAMAAYGGIWLKQQGFTETEIGIINAAPIGLVILLNLWMGRLADRASDWKDAIRLMCLFSIIGPVGLFFGGGFWAVLTFFTIILLAHGLLIPVADAAIMRLGAREGFDFARIRACGTVGYISGIVITGFLAGIYGPVVFLPAVLIGILLRALFAETLPKLRGARDAAAIGARNLGEVMRPWFLLPLCGWSLIYGALAILGPFQALLWEEEGISPIWITILVATAPIAETLLFLGFKRFGRRFRARHLILVSALAMVLRLVGFGLEPGVIWLIPLQCLHALTYTLGFLGCVTFIANWTSEDIAAEAQSFFVMLQQIATALMLILFGWLAQSFGAQAYFALAALCALGAGLIALSLRLAEPPRS